jgi:hypothetical protein
MMGGGSVAVYISPAGMLGAGITTSVNTRPVTPIRGVVGRTAAEEIGALGIPTQTVVGGLSATPCSVSSPSGPTSVTATAPAISSVPIAKRVDVVLDTQKQSLLVRLILQRWLCSALLQREPTVEETQRLLRVTGLKVEELAVPEKLVKPKAKTSTQRSQRQRQRQREKTTAKPKAKRQKKEAALEGRGGKEGAAGGNAKRGRGGDAKNTDSGERSGSVAFVKWLGCTNTNCGKWRIVEPDVYARYSGDTNEGDDFTCEMHGVMCATPTDTDPNAMTSDAEDGEGDGVGGLNAGGAGKKQKKV